MTQCYENKSEDAPLETVFYYPIIPDYILSKITIEFTEENGKTRTVETVIEEKVTA